MLIKSLTSLARETSRGIFCKVCKVAAAGEMIPAKLLNTHVERTHVMFISRSSDGPGASSSLDFRILNVCRTSRSQTRASRATLCTRATRAPSPPTPARGISTRGDGDRVLLTLGFVYFAELRKINGHLRWRARCLASPARPASCVL